MLRKMKYIAYILFVFVLAYFVFKGYHIFRPMVCVCCIFGYEITNYLFKKENQTHH